MGEGMQLLNEILQQGSKEMGDAFLKGMEDMKETMRESLDEMKKRRQEMEKSRPDSKNDPHTDTGEGMI